MQGCEIRRDEPMNAHTTFRIGGPADLFIIPCGVDALIGAVAELKRDGVPYVILGGGSNLLVRDGGVRGAVISTEALTAMEDTDERTIQAECGVMLGHLAARARDRSLTGLEFAQGIPGTVGGGVYMNAGAYGGDMSQVVSETDYLTADGELLTLPAERHDYGYRTSLFTKTRGVIILRSRMRLTHGDHDEIALKMNDYRERRRNMQPLEFPSAGSAFKRPSGMFAGKLIADAGLKGLAVGGAQVSEKHAGFVINTGGATAADVEALLELIVARVREAFGVTLEREIRIIGEREV